MASTIFYTGTVGGTPSGTLIDTQSLTTFNTPPSTSRTVGTITFNFITDAAVVNGGKTNVYAPPYLSAGEAALLGQPTGPDQGNYLTTGSNGAYKGAAIDMTFSAPQYSFGMIWGSIDKYNTVALYSGGVNGTLVGTVTGGQIDATAHGDQSQAGTYGVSIWSPLQSFDTVVFTSSNYAFEFTGLTYTNGSHNPPPGLPEPGSLALFGAGLGLLGLARFATRRGKADTQPRLAA
ncbi:MAG: PEP-CTERM sorting domain-containing protein [Rhodospirillales bacterium]|nr:PEP-CTERM sorting domain-containing protein [Rhodospirillales bacterium]